MTRTKRRISEAERYLLDVQSGKITACKRVKQLAEMMLPRFEDGYKRWHFDYEKANRPVRFIEKFCMLPSGRLGVPFELEPYQKAITQMAFGFVDDDDLRQFQQIMVVMARKNGKTSWGAALEMYMLIADGEGAPQVYNVATSKDQASLAYGAAVKMLRQSKELSKVVRKGTVVERDQDGLICDRTMGYITPLTAQTRHLDGLDVHFCLFDEMAATTNRDQFDLIWQGMSSRSQPMLWACTTNGFERDNLFDDQYDYGCGILDGTIDDPRMLPAFYELDDRSEWVDETMWLKANPGLGRIKKVSALRDNVSKAQQDPSALPSVMVKDFDVPESRASAWLSFDEAVNEEPLPFPMNENPGMPSGEKFRYGVGGIDASDTTDLSAAKVLMMRPDDPKLYVLSMYWVPEAALQNESGYRKERDNVPYRLWAQKGYLRTIPGNIVPKSVFIEWFEEVKREYDVWLFGLGYDRWGFGDEDIQRFEQYVGKERSEVVRQGPMTFSSPMKELRAMYAANQVVDGHNPINEWCRMNVQVKQDYNANIRPVKAEGKAIHRIDGFMSELNGFIAMQRHLEEYKGAI